MFYGFKYVWGGFSPHPSPPCPLHSCCVPVLLLQTYVVRILREGQGEPQFVFRTFDEFQELHNKLSILFPLWKLPGYDPTISSSHGLCRGSLWELPTVKSQNTTLHRQILSRKLKYNVPSLTAHTVFLNVITILNFEIT